MTLFFLHYRVSLAGRRSLLKTNYGDFRVHLSSKKSGAIVTAKGKGAVACVSRRAAEFGMAALKDGGNAFDAAFALAFALALYHPQAGNIGGGGYLLFKQKGSAKPTAFNYREESPEGATREAFLLPDCAPDPEVTAFGPKSACVPGTVKAFFTLQNEFGRLKAKDILLALRRRAEEGAYVTQYEAECLNRLAPKLAVSPESRRVYVKGTGPFEEGDVIQNPNLAKTFETLAIEGEKAFYRGKIAEQIERDIGGNGGFLTVEDLAEYSIKQVEPLSAEIGGKRVWTVPPEAGGSLLVEILNILDREAFFSIRPWTADFFHYIAQASKMAFIDRLDYLGDIPLETNDVYRGIFDKSRADRLFGLIDRESDRPTDELARDLRAGSTGVQKDGPSGCETTHFSVVDAEGNAVSSSYTLNLRYGSKWSVEGAGFLLNGSMDAFSFSEGKANYFGVIGSVPNLFDRRKRPASNMAPVLVTDGSTVEMILGTPGGPTIPTTLSFVLLSIIAHGLDPREVCAAGRVHHQGWPDLLYTEKGTLSENLLSGLTKKGYTLEDKNEPIGDVHAVFRNGSEYLAVSDYRREGCALSHQ